MVGAASFKRYRKHEGCCYIALGFCSLGFENIPVFHFFFLKSLGIGSLQFLSSLLGVCFSIGCICLNLGYIGDFGVRGLAKLRFGMLLFSFYLWDWGGGHCSRHFFTSIIARGSRYGLFWVDMN
jgi:hypothetical protein